MFCLNSSPNELVLLHHENRSVLSFSILAGSHYVIKVGSKSSFPTVLPQVCTGVFKTLPKAVDYFRKTLHLRCLLWF